MESPINFYDRNFFKSKEILDKISGSFCAAKWLQVSLHLTNGRTHSCYHPPTHQINLEKLKETPSALHNTDIKFLERKQMLEGNRPSGCDYCWKIEDAGHISDRYYRSSEHWAINHLENLRNLPFDHSINPTYVEVNFNQTCNFKCSYCSPHLSSEWQNEIEKYGPYKIDDYLHNQLSQLTELGLMPIETATKDNPYIQAFWQWWPDLYKDLKVFRMTGGEPLLDRNTFKVLDYVFDHPNKNLEISITSNLCPPRQDIFDKFLEKIKRFDRVNYQVECYVQDPKDGSEWQTWKHFIIGKDQKEYHNSDLSAIERSDIPETFQGIGHAKETGSFTYLYEYQDRACKHFTLYVSLDSVDEQAEYIRNGLNFDTLKKNVEKFLEETENTSVSFINTFNILSIPNFKKFLEYIWILRKKYSTNGRQRIWFDIPLLKNPEWMNVLNAEDDHVLKLKHALFWMKSKSDQELYKLNHQGFKIYEIDKLQRNIDYIEKNRFDESTKKKNIKNFSVYFKEHDKRRGTDFIKSFPEFRGWYENNE